MTSGEIYRVAAGGKRTAMLWAVHDEVDVCPGFEDDTLVNKEKREAVEASLED
ncbi:hypothetical protein [Pandoraea anapnoica]|nr:hypothetical protein [Pandoraea anapnoica]